jgi:hypothetical protein
MEKKKDRMWEKEEDKIEKEEKKDDERKSRRRISYKEGQEIHEILTVSNCLEVLLLIERDGNIIWMVWVKNGFEYDMEYKPMKTKCKRKPKQNLERQLWGRYRN